MKRHPLDTVSLVFGLLLTGVGAAFLTTDVDLSLASLRWIWPAVLVATGVAVLFGARRSDES